MSQENVELVLRVHRAVVEGDLDGFLSGVHPKGEYLAATQQAIEGEGSAFRGHDGLRRWFRELHDLYEDLDTEILEVRDLGDQVLLDFVVRGRGAGSGVTLEQSLAQVATLRDGKVIEIREYFSTEEAVDAVTQLVRTAYDTWSSGGPSAFVRLTSPDVELYDAPELPDAQHWVGHEAVVARLEELVAATGGRWADIDDIRLVGDQAVVALTWRLDRASPATLGSVYHVVSVEGDLITRIRVFLDETQAMGAAQGA